MKLHRWIRQANYFEQTRISKSIQTNDSKPHTYHLKNDLLANPVINKKIYYLFTITCPEFSLTKFCWHNINTPAYLRCQFMFNEFIFYLFKCFI